MIDTKLLKSVYLNIVSKLVEQKPNLPAQLIHNEATEKAATKVWQKAGGTIDWDDCLLESYCLTSRLADAIGLSVEVE